MLFETKDSLRKIFRDKRQKLSDKERQIKDREIARNFYANISLKPRSVIAGYIAMRGEVDISLLLEMYEDDDHIICLPCVEEKDAPLTFRRYPRGSNLIKGSLGIQEPQHSFEELIPNLIITPLVAFDSAGTRLGMGAGYYDRTFDALKGYNDFIAVGVAYTLQQAPYIRPAAHDFKLDALVTEEKVHIFS